RRSAMGVPGADEATDAINAAVWALHSGKTPEQALAFFRETHGSLMRKLGTLSDADLQRPYNHYQPNDRRDASDNRPVVDWVAGRRLMIGHEQDRHPARRHLQCAGDQAERQHLLAGHLEAGAFESVAHPVRVRAQGKS